MKSSARYYSVERQNIGYIRYIFEAHEGIAVVSTIGSAKDTIAVYVPPGCDDEVDQVIKGLADEGMLKEKVLNDNE